MDDSVGKDLTEIVNAVPDKRGHADIKGPLLLTVDGNRVCRRVRKKLERVLEKVSGGPDDFVVLGSGAVVDRVDLCGHVVARDNFRGLFESALRGGVVRILHLERGDVAEEKDVGFGVFSEDGGLVFGAEQRGKEGEAIFRRCVQLGLDDARDDLDQGYGVEVFLESLEKVQVEVTHVGDRGVVDDIFHFLRAFDMGVEGIVC